MVAAGEWARRPEREATQEHGAWPGAEGGCFMGVRDHTSVLLGPLTDACHP